MTTPEIGLGQILIEPTGTGGNAVHLRLHPLMTAIHG